MALQEQCSTVHAMISIMYRDAVRLGFALHHKAHPSAALNSTHYTLGLGIGDQQTKLNIVCVLWLCVCVMSVYLVWVCTSVCFGAGHDGLLPRALSDRSSLFSPFMCWDWSLISCNPIGWVNAGPAHGRALPFSCSPPHSGGKGETSASRRRKSWTNTSTRTSATRIRARRLKRSWRRSAASQFPRWVVLIWQ